MISTARSRVLDSVAEVPRVLDELRGDASSD